MPTEPSVLGRVGASSVVVGTVVGCALTIMTCYVIAVVHGDVAINLLPMISDTFVSAPESYISRFGMITSASAFQLLVWVTYGYLKTFASSGEIWGWSAFGNTLFGAVAGVSLGMVGAISDAEDNPVHSTFAVLFFLCALAWIIGFTIQLACHSASTSRTSIRIKAVSATVTFVALVIFTTLAGDYKKNYRYIAICEWSAVASILVALSSLSLEFGNSLSLGDLWLAPDDARLKRASAAEDGELFVIYHELTPAV